MCRAWQDVIFINLASKYVKIGGPGLGPLWTSLVLISFLLQKDEVHICLDNVSIRQGCLQIVFSSF